IDNQPILRVLGDVRFDVTRWLPEHRDGTVVDTHGVVSLEGRGSIRSPNGVRYTTTSVVVADPAAADQKEADPAQTSMPTDPELRRKLANFHAKSDRERDSAAATTEDLSPTNSAPTATVGEVADDKTSSSATAPYSAAAFPTVAAARNDGDGDGDKTAAASKATPASATSTTATAPPVTPSPGTAANPSTRADVGNNPASGASVADFMTGKAHQARTVNEHDKKTGGGRGGGGGGGGEGSSSIPLSNSWTTKKKTRQQQQQQQQQDRRDSKRSGTGGNDNSNGSSGKSWNGNNNNHHHRHNNNNNHNSNGNSNGNSYSPPNQFHPETVLRAGRYLFGKLMSPGKKALIYVSPDSGSVVHAGSDGRAPRDEEGRKIGPVPQKLRTILNPNQRQMAKVERNRSEIWAERDEKKKAIREGREIKKSKVAAIMGVLPFGKNGFRRRRAREHAEAHLMEATLHLTKKGDLEVSIDGTIVQTKSRSSWFGFLRRKDPSFELRVTREGIEVSRRGKLDWVIKAEDIF
ncbi:unnamed protein product, partial [Ectocarpus fasciculatus]